MHDLCLCFARGAPIWAAFLKHRKDKGGCVVLLCAGGALGCKAGRRGIQHLQDTHRVQRMLPAQWRRAHRCDLSLLQTKGSKLSMVLAYRSM